MIVEYTGNKWKHGPGTIDVANLGYGMSGGKDYIWITMPHTDMWMHRDSPHRRQARAWLRDVFKGEEKGGGK